MDYYYALLENYDQLKRRKFKLSLREEEAQEGEGMTDEQKAQDLQSKAGPDKDNPAEVNGVNLYRQDDKVMGRLANDSSPQPQTAMLAKGNELGKAPSSMKMLGMIYGGEKPEGDQEKEKDPTQVAEPVDPAQQQARAAVQKASDIQSNVTPDKLPGYDEASRYSRLGNAVRLAGRRVEGETEGGEGLSKQSSAFGDTTVEQQLISSPELDLAQVTKATDAMTNTMEAVLKIQSGEKLTTEELRDLSSKIEVTDQGIKFEGIYFQYRSSSNKKNDPYRNMADQINQAILENNDKLKGLDKNSEAYKEGFVKPLVAKNIGRVLSNRGPILEQVDVINLLGTALANCQKAGKECPDIEKKIGDYYEQATKDQTVEQIEEMMKKGLCAAAGQCLVDIKGAEDAVIVDSVYRFLTGTDQDGNLIKGQEGPRMKPEVARALIDQASKNGSLGLALLVASSRGFSKPYEDLEVVDAEQYGGVGADLKGQKDDLRVIVTEESYNKFVNKLEKNRTEIEAKQAEMAKCAGEGVGASNLAKKGSVSEMADAKPGQVTLSIEKKSLNSIGSRIKSGEGTTNKFRNSCKSDERGKNDLEKQFYEANDRRLASCQGDQKFGSKKQSAREAACSFQDKVDNSPTMKSFRTLSEGGYVVDSDGNRVENAGAALVDQWEESSGMAEPKKSERARLAREAFSILQKGGQPNKEQKEALSKVGENLEQAEISRQLDADTDENGVVTGEGLGYILQRQSEDAGSLEECLKDVASMEDGKQRFGLINETVYGTFGLVCAGEGVVRRNKGSLSYSVETNDGQKMMGGGFERGQLVVDVAPDAMGDPSSESGEGSQEEMFLSFLKGQQELIEQIMRQTSAGPNF